MEGAGDGGEQCARLEALGLEAELVAEALEPVGERCGLCQLELRAGLEQSLRLDVEGGGDREPDRLSDGGVVVLRRPLSECELGLSYDGCCVEEVGDGPDFGGVEFAGRVGEAHYDANADALPEGEQDAAAARGAGSEMVGNLVGEGFQKGHLDGDLCVASGDQSGSRSGDGVVVRSDGTVGAGRAMGFATGASRGGRSRGVGATAMTVAVSRISPFRTTSSRSGNQPLAASA